MGPQEQRSLPEWETTPRPTLLLEVVTLASLATAVLSLFFFAWIAESVSRDRTEGFDLAVRNGLHHYASPGLTHAMVAISFLGGDGLVLAAFLSFAVFLGLRWRRAALWLLTTILGALVLDVALKYAFHRPRPVPFFGDVPHTYSFPSGHSLFSFCLYGVLAGILAHRTKSYRVRVLIWTLGVFLIAAIGLSRIYLGVHYPSDVIAGYLTAALWVSTLVFLDRVRNGKKKPS